MIMITASSNVEEGLQAGQGVEPREHRRQFKSLAIEAQLDRGPHYLVLLERILNPRDDHHELMDPDASIAKTFIQPGLRRQVEEVTRAPTQLQCIAVKTMGRARTRT